MVRAGLLAAGAVITLVAVWLLTLASHWFQGFLLLIGVGTLGAGFIPDRPAPAPAASLPVDGDRDVRERLRELDAMLADGVITKPEHAAKRRTLLAEWGRPRA